MGYDGMMNDDEWNPPPGLFFSTRHHPPSSNSQDSYFTPSGWLPNFPPAQAAIARHLHRSKQGRETIPGHLEVVASWNHRKWPKTHSLSEWGHPEAYLEKMPITYKKFDFPCCMPEFHKKKLGAVVLFNYLADFGGVLKWWYWWYP